MVTSPLSLYFHIPFCRRKCPYCHFYVVPEHEAHKELLFRSLLLEWQRIFLKVNHHEIVSIYFGGGTPSLFGPDRIGALLDRIDTDARVSPNCEITLEANPEDITKQRMLDYRGAGINRVSIGVQSLVDASLTVLERTHSAPKAISAISDTYEAGISNITIDLMYELPNQTIDSFQQSLDQLKDLPISHLSLYNLTIEPHTPFSKQKLHLPEEEEGLAMLQSAISHLESMGLKRYEISAFAKCGFKSHHNMGYWIARPFFGLGPSAFSYYEESRFRNIANLNRYARALSEGSSPIDFLETLPYPQNVQELLAVELRLIAGVELDRFKLNKKKLKEIEELKAEGLLELKGGRTKLTKKGLLFYDSVAARII